MISAGLNPKRAESIWAPTSFLTLMPNFAGRRATYHINCYVIPTTRKKTHKKRTSRFCCRCCFTISLWETYTSPFRGICISQSGLCEKTYILDAALSIVPSFFSLVPQTHWFCAAREYSILRLGVGLHAVDQFFHLMKVSRWVQGHPECGVSMLGSFFGKSTYQLSISFALR